MKILFGVGLILGFAMMVVGGVWSSEDCNKNPKTKKIGQPLVISGAIIFLSLEIWGIWTFP